MYSDVVKKHDSSRKITRQLSSYEAHIWDALNPKARWYVFGLFQEDQCETFDNRWYDYIQQQLQKQHLGAIYSSCGFSAKVAHRLTLHEQDCQAKGIEVEPEGLIYHEMGRILDFTPPTATGKTVYLTAPK